MTEIDELKFEERLALKLKALYRSYGFTEYRLLGFEDYSLYADNKSFLDGNGVLTFVSDGRLTALRPDVTLSIAKGVNVKPNDIKKLFYDEAVYRKAKGGGEFNELRQVGIEVIGDVDGVTQAEVCELMLKTLGAAGKKFIADISHAGIIQKLLDGMGLDGAERNIATACLERKCAHDFLKLNISDGKYKTAFLTLMSLAQEPDKALKALKAIKDCVGIVDEVSELEQLAAIGDGKIRIDFSIGGDAQYYNGAVFKGYIDGVPYSVLSGGRYDKLLGKFGKNAKAVGFALYIGELCEYFDDIPDRPDVKVVYTSDNADKAVKLAAKLRGEGKKVLLCRNADEFAGEIVYAEDGKND